MRRLSRRMLTGLVFLGVPGVTLVACSSAYRGEEGLDSDEALGSVRQALTTTVTFQQGASSYTGSTDATIRQASPSTNYGNATSCEADGDDGGGVDKSCLLRWSVPSLPADAEVIAASITLRITDGSSESYGLYPLSRSWSEAEVTWTSAATSANWATPGALGAADRGSMLASVSGNNGSTTLTLDPAGVALVKVWANGGPNHGLVVASTSNTNGLRFASSEHGTVSYRPRLSITYTTSGDAGGSGGAAGSSGSAGSGGSAGSSGSGGSGGSAGSSGSGGSAGSSGSGGAAGNPGASPQPNVLIAFMGDQGNGSNADAVLQLIKNEGAAATVHNGDFDYANDPAAFDRRINSILGESYPYYAIIGNHDAAAWGGPNGYASKLAARAARVPEMSCVGELGVRANCNFRGVHLVQSCVGTSELRSSCGANSADQIGFIQSSLAASTAPFKICNWHKNQNDMQTGTKGNEVGWQAYQACAAAGAVIATGHEHSYERTRLLSNIGSTAAAHGVTGPFDHLALSPGSSFVFVSGLGGVDIRAFDTASHNDDTWWATTYASNRWYKNGVAQSASNIAYGALFVRFHDGGNPRRAVAYFKDLNGRLVDEFTIEVP